MQFREKIHKLKESLHEEGLAFVLKQLILNFNKDSSKYNALILLKAEHKSLDEKIIIGVIDYTKENLHLAQIRGRLLRFIDNLEPSDYSLDKNFEIDTIEFGLKDLPSKVLISMGKMTPNEARQRLKRHSSLIKEQTENLNKAEEKKEILGLTAMNKLNALKNSGSNNIRLYKKFIKDFALAFKDYDKEIVNLSEALNNVRDDAGMLCLFQIQHAFSSNNHEQEDFKELIDLSNKLIQQFEKMTLLFDERIESEKLNLLRYRHEAEFYEIKGRMKKSINSKILLKDSFNQFTKEWRVIHDSILYYDEKING